MCAHYIAYKLYVSAKNIYPANYILIVANFKVYGICTQGK